MLFVGYLQSTCHGNNASRSGKPRRMLKLIDKEDQGSLVSLLVKRTDELVIKLDHLHQSLDGHPFIDSVHACSSGIVTCTPG